MSTIIPWTKIRHRNTRWRILNALRNCHRGNSNILKRTIPHILPQLRFYLFFAACLLSSHFLAVCHNYNPSNCFFFISNSSCVMMPISNSSLYFLISSIGEFAGASVLVCDCATSPFFISVIFVELQDGQRP